MARHLRGLVDQLITRILDEYAVCDFCGFDNLVARRGVQSVVCSDCLDVMEEFGVLL